MQEPGQLTDGERMLLELLQEKDAEAQRQSQERSMRFLAIVAERTGIPVAVLGIHPQTGVITDARVAVEDHTAHDDDPPDDR